VLGDLAPALMLLPKDERGRYQALAAWVAVLFDFAWQRGIEGERLTALNQWQYRLEETLEGALEPDQPILLRMLDEHRRRRWSLAGLGRIRQVAETQITHPPTSLEESAESTRKLASRLVESLLERPDDEICALAAGLLRLRALQDLGEGLRQRRPTPGVLRLSDMSAPTSRPGQTTAGDVADAVAAECEQIHPLLLAAGGSIPSLPSSLQRPALYLVFSGIALLTRIEAGGEAVLNRPPHLGPWERIRLLFRARWAAR